MLDNIENQRLQERIAEVAPLLAGLVAESASSPDDPTGEPDCPPFRKDKVERILDRVYDRLADEASEPADPRLRELLAEAVARLDAPCAAFGDGKVERILDRVRARLTADTMTDPLRVVAAKKSVHKSAALLRLGSVAVFMLRHLSVERRPFRDGPAEC
ncbi:MAG TPA: hypothetical protein VH643_39360 [Gemmataceae bacterium]|jgi:hypothetical protein